jgi:hypothetical protein
MNTFRRYRKEFLSNTSPRTNIINWIISNRNYKRYLEIGVFDPNKNFNKIKIPFKISVDPGKEGLSEATYTLTSDEFFKQNTEKFDIIFIDGLHESEQVYIDIMNSLDALEDGGTILTHDMNPQKKRSQVVPQVPGLWNGDCWKAFVKIRTEFDNLKMNVIDHDWGVGVIRRGQQELLKNVNYTYEDFDLNRNEWLNLISFKNFKNEFYAE